MGRVAVILAGCGYLDGSEIHESVLCLLALVQAGREYEIFAPNVLQRNVVNHLTRNDMLGESRNVLVEAARIARGHIHPLSDLKSEKFDALLIPGGNGVALNLSSFAIEEEECEVNEELARVIKEFHQRGRPIGATCIAPAILARVFQGIASIRLTLGSEEANRHLEHMGMEAVPADSKTVVADESHKIYTTPCYMNPPDLAGMYEAIKKLVSRL